MNKGVYKRIVDAYLEVGSVYETAKRVGVAFVTAQRVLITERLWKSPRSESILYLRSIGKTVSEIARELVVSEKSVQAYLPYSKIA